jgi:hypothetical protein
VLEHVGGDQHVEAALRLRVLDVARDHLVEPLARFLGIGRLELDADDVGSLAGLQRRARGVGRAAEVEHPPRGRRDVLEDLRPGALVGRRAGRALTGPHRRRG